MRKLKLTISYDGSFFYGFQRQNDKRSVQKDIELVLSSIYKEDIVIKGAGRTDRGVHAKGQVITFEEPYIINNLKQKLNKSLSNIKVKSIKVVNKDFHPRFSVKEKSYVYQLSTSNKENSNYYGIYTYNLDLKDMKKATKVFIGTHNFQNFVSGNRDNYVCTIFNIQTKIKKNKIIFKFTGHGFYRYMVRNLVGALVDLGKGKVSIEDIENMLINHDIDKRLSTAKPEGLYLMKIKY